MARAPVLGGGSLNPFGGPGIDFGAFDIGGTDRESRLILTRVEVRWEAGEATDEEYVAALRAYSTTLAQNSSEWLNNEQRVKSLEYRIKREVLVAKIDDGTKELTDLLAFDRAGMAGLATSSSTYRDRRAAYQNTQAQLLAELEEPVMERYSDGKMTSAQLKAWYQDRLDDADFADNNELAESVRDRIGELNDRIVDERDAEALDKFQAGKMTPKAFVAYATSARARYAAGTPEYRQWSERLEQANDSSREQALLYRYDLSQQYAQLQAFVASNSKAPSGGVSKGRTSTSKRVVLGADGKWKTVTTTRHTPGKAYGPSPSEQRAWQQRQIEVADAKKQMREIARKLNTVGGAIGTNYMIGYYEKQLKRFAKGSSEWYAVQGKLDSLNDRKHEEAVMSKQGIRISYPSSSGSGGGSGGSSSAGGGGGGSRGSATSGSAARISGGGSGKGITLEKFMHAIASVESGGRYNARNSSSGAYGKYQIMPSNWSSWAQKAGLPGNAPQTPKNQEIVATAAFTRLWNSLKDWRLVAIAWHSGTSVANNLNNIGPNGRRYVNLVSQKLGMGSVTVSGGRISGGGNGVIGSGGGSGRNGGYAGTASPGSGGGAGGGGGYAPPKGGGKTSSGGGGPTGSTSKATGKGPLQVITGVTAPANRPGFDVHTQRVGFPANLDGEAFKKFYAQYQDAFESGAESFSVNSPGGEIHYFIGDDPKERIDGMKQLDQLRIELFQTRMVAYAGTPSEITAANQFDDAIEDAARNKFLVLSMTNNERTAETVPGKARNPLAEGIEMINERKAGIESHVKAMEAALKRGDLDAAWGHWQLAAGLRASAENALRTYVAGAESKIRAIEKKYGVSLSEALGKDGGIVGGDLEDLIAGGDELDKVFGNADVHLTELRKYVQVDREGNLQKDQLGAQGQLLLKDDFIRVMKKDGTVEFRPAPKSVDARGNMARDLEGLVKMDVKVGTRTVEAYGEYKVGNVGVIKAPDGSLIPIQGKIIQYVDPTTGQQKLVMENPFAPGHWSTTPIRYNAPKAGTFKSIAATGGGVALQFTTPKAGGKTFTLQLDPKTGTYMLYATTPPGFLGQGGEENAPLGNVGEGYALDLFKGAGFVRDLTGLKGDAAYWADQSNPVIGFSASEHKQWRSNGLNQFMPNLTKLLQAQYGALTDVSKMFTKGTYAYSEKGAGGRPKLSVVPDTLGGRKAGAGGRPSTLGGRTAQGSEELERARNARATLPGAPGTLKRTSRPGEEAGRADNMRATLPSLKKLPVTDTRGTSEASRAGNMMATLPKPKPKATAKSSTTDTNKRRASGGPKNRPAPKPKPALKPLPKPRPKPKARRSTSRRPSQKSPSITNRTTRSGRLEKDL